MRLTEEYARPVFGFALKRCRTEEDAEDLSQEIILKVYTAFTTRNDIEEPDRFVWRVAHNILANYYRGLSRAAVGIPMEDVENSLTSADRGVEDDIILREDTDRLRREIAYLSATRRRVLIAHYYEGQTVTAIARELSLPEGTVKWHLYEAKRDLKKGMETMRQTSDLKFNPIKFERMGFSGKSGTKKISELFRSVLSQNILYCVKDEVKSVGQIADDLGVSPVYVEGEVEYLCEYGFLTKKGNGYLSNVVIEEITENVARTTDRVYERAAEIFADDLLCQLKESGILEDSDICGGYDPNLTMTSETKRDPDFLLWSIFPFVISDSFAGDVEEISFDEVATIRPDGGHNIAHFILTESGVRPCKYLNARNLKGWNGPFHFCDRKRTFWRIDSEWSKNRVKDVTDYSDRVLSLIDRWSETGELSPDEYAYLGEIGVLQTLHGENGTKTHLGCIRISRNVRDRLIAMGREVRLRHKDELDSLKREYISAVLENTPAHLKAAHKYMLQYVFSSDGYFLYACLRHLVDTGKLKEPEGEEMRYVSTIIIE